MKLITTLILSVITGWCTAQKRSIVGTYTNSKILPSLVITFNQDSTFSYKSTAFQNEFNINEFQENGVWRTKSDTLILNPELPKKSFGGFELLEQKNTQSSKIQLRFNHVKRTFDRNGKLVKTDTTQIKQFDFAFNKNSRKNRTRITTGPTTRCAFAGFIPKEIITSEKVINLEKANQRLEKLYIGCYELKGTKEFILKSPNSNIFTLNVYSNFFEDGQIRQVKYLIKNEDVLFIKQKPDGRFQKDGLYIEELIIRKTNNDQLATIR